jgi:hypothetical protein
MYGRAQSTRRKQLLRPMKSFVPALLVAVAVGAPLSAQAANSINLIYSGAAVANSVLPPTHLPTYDAWCSASGATFCVPTVQQTMFDMSTGQAKGTIYVYAAFPFNGGAAIMSSFCFSEFFVVALAEGDLHAHTGPNGTCGATMDSGIKPPDEDFPLADMVIAGGGDGVIVGGTGKYARWTGTFTDRVFVGFSSAGAGVSGIVYYDSLMFSFTGK